LRAFLCSTQGLFIAEASPHDAIWGIGLSADDPRAQDVENWPGLNLLGKALVQVRNELWFHDKKVSLQRFTLRNSIKNTRSMLTKNNKTQLLILWCFDRL